MPQTVSNVSPLPQHIHRKAQIPKVALVISLEGLAEGPDEVAVREAVEPLVVRWTPLEDDDLYRGDGCMACSAYGETCGGIE